MPFLALLVSGLSNVFAILVKHPILTKMIMFSFFTGILSVAITKILNYMYPYIAYNSAFQLASYFGAIAALNLYISIVAGGFFMKQIVGFIKNT